jgi:hypothetical protein
LNYCGGCRHFQLNISDDALGRFATKASILFSQILEIPQQRNPRFGLGTPQSIFGHSQGAALVERFILDLLNMPSSYYFIAREGRIAITPTTDHGAFLSSARTGEGSERNGISAVVSSALSRNASSLPGLSDLETLINSPTTKEADLQCFFSSHPHFLFALDERYCEIRSHVCLVDSQKNRHVPEFMARIEDSLIWDVIELKRPQHHLTRTLASHRPSALAARGIAELIRYRDFFGSSNNRKRVASVFGTPPYEPALVLVIGRGRSTTRYEWSTAKLGFPRVQVVSYDYLFQHARQCSAYLRTVEKADLRTATATPGDI